MFKSFCLALMISCFITSSLGQTRCTTKYSRRNGTCTEPRSCPGALFNNMCPGSQLCCVDDPNIPSRFPTFISKSSFDSILGQTSTRANAIYRTLNPPKSSPTCFQVASFLSQLAHESGSFLYGEEIGSSAYFNKYEYTTDKGRELGNTQWGDGEKFKGRGFIQITGRGNYRRAGAALGLNLESDPELASFPSIAARIAVWFWTSGSSVDLNSLADGTFYSYSLMTSKINGGLNGILDRTNKFETAAKVLGCGAIKKGGKFEPSCSQTASKVGLTAKCTPLCWASGLEGKSFCGCSGIVKPGVNWSYWTGVCSGPKNLVCCLPY